MVLRDSYSAGGDEPALDLDHGGGRVDEMLRKDQKFCYAIARETVFVFGQSYSSHSHMCMYYAESTEGRLLIGLL